jgi:uncharacterized protein (TIGR02145 family)
MKKLKVTTIPLLLIGVFLIAALSCKKDEDESVPSLPVIITSDVTALLNTADYGGNITSDGGYFVTQRGVCINTSPDPTVNNTTTNNGTGAGIFTGKLIDLIPNTAYYIRAYAITSQGISYGATIKFTTLNTTMKDIENNEYRVIQVVNQVWMAENLQVKKFNNNMAIPLVTDAGTWKALTSPGYCWYGNDSTTYAKTYGALYNWYAAISGKVCPSGWHVPSSAEWDTLLINVGGSNNAGATLKESGTTHWTSPNSSATDAFNFTARPGGFRDNGGNFSENKNYGFWWTTSPWLFGEANAFALYMFFNNNKTPIIYRSKLDGNSIRCVKD